MLAIGGFLLLIRLASNQTPVSDLMQSLAGVFVWLKESGLFARPLLGHPGFVLSLSNDYFMAVSYQSCQLYCSAYLLI